MSGIRVAKRYAKALSEAAEAAGALSAVVEDVSLISSLMEIEGIRTFCFRPSVSKEAAREFVETALTPNMKSAVTKRFLDAVLDNARLGLLPLLGDAFGEVMDAKNGIVRVEAVFASPPDDRLLKDLEAKVERRVGGSVRLEPSVDGRLIKGFKLLWNNRLLDRSVAGGIRGMRLALKR